MWEEDVIAEMLKEDVCRERMVKYRDIVYSEYEMQKEDKIFKGFYSNEDHWSKLEKCVTNFDELVAQVQEEIRKRIDPEYSNDEIVVEVSNEEDIPNSFEWVE